MKILWTQTAYDRIEEIYSYIESDSPSAAQKWVLKLLSKVEQLGKTPKIGRKVPEIGSSSIRELIYNNYRIIYRVTDLKVFILTIRHFKQILPLDELQ
jgi:addiction module RelE/StbE family toxin